MIGPSGCFHTEREVLSELRAQRKHVAGTGIELFERGHRLRQLIRLREL